MTNIVKEMRDLGVPFSAKFNADRSIFDEFKNGILLIEIVQVMEMTKIEGINLNPKSKAEEIRNIKKALEFLKRKSSIPMTLLVAEADINKGERAVIFKLLKYLRKAYS